MKKIMVTGSTGFFGANLVYLLVDSGFDVIAAKRPTSDTWRLKGVIGKINLVNMDILDRSTIEDTVSTYRPDIVIHCISYGVEPSQKDPKLATATNINGSCDLLEICAKYQVERFVYTGSCFEYGSKDHSIRENELLQPTTLYGATKSAASLLLLEAGNRLKVDTLVLRLFGMWGPFEGSYRLVPQIINAFLENKTLDLTGGTQVRDYTYVVDMAEYVKMFATCADFSSNSIFNLGSGQPVILRDFVLNIAKELGCTSLMRFGNLQYRAQEMNHVVADVSKAHSFLGHMKPTSLREGLAAMMMEQKKEAL